MKEYKNLYLGFACLLSLLTGLLSVSCNGDDMFGGGSGNVISDNICFGISNDDGQSGTRSSAEETSGEESVMANFVMRGDTPADTLCVRASVCDFGPLPLKNSKSQTRAALQTKNSMTSFGVTACMYSAAESKNLGYYFFNEKNETTGSNVWTFEGGKLYYWPGDKFKFNFYAYSPFECEGLTLTPAVDDRSGKAPVLNYTVPTDADKQTDLLTANPPEVAGDNKESVPLTFQHICTAVEFVQGADMQSGTIKSISLKGVYSSDSYSFEKGDWNKTYQNKTETFTQELNKATSTTGGTPITTDNNCFVMLPQTLPAGASIEVVFNDGKSADKTLTASLAGQEWPQGKIVKYKISIKPDYDLHFDQEPVAQDAHYVIYPIKIHVDKTLKDGWTMTSNNEYVTLTDVYTDLAEQGYWIGDDDKGKNGEQGGMTLESTETGDLTVYAYLVENIGDKARDITLSLRPTKYKNAKPDTFHIKQLCPSWKKGLGCERIEEGGPYPWGFLWPDGYKVIYNMGTGPLHWLWRIIFDIFVKPDYVSSKGIGLLWDDWIVTIDYSQVEAPNVSLDENDGKKNTSELYNYNGISDVDALSQRLENWDGERSVEPKDAEAINPSEFAAKTCAKKNKYHKVVYEQDGEIAERPVLNPEDLVWYLPAKNEIPNISDGDHPLLGVYWTSTAVNDQKKAYKFTAGSTYADETELRDIKLNVRAVRKKPTIP